MHLLYTQLDPLGSFKASATRSNWFRLYDKHLLVQFSSTMFKNVRVRAGILVGRTFKCILTEPTNAII